MPGLGTTTVSTSVDEDEVTSSRGSRDRATAVGTSAADPRELTGEGRRRVINLTPRTTAIGAVVPTHSNMKNFLDASLDDVHRTWTRTFAAKGWRAPQVRYYWPESGEVLRTACTGASDDMSFFYCPVDDTIVISQMAAYNLWRGNYGRVNVAGTGDMSVALLVAHEYGHNLIKEWGFTPSAARGERAADCLAGAWAANAHRRGILERGDVMEAWQGLDAVAEKEGQSDNGVHGTPAQRQQAFNTGWYHGSTGCMNAYLR